MSTIQAIPLEQIQPSPYQARKDFDPEALQSLADSIKEEGLLNPIVVRPSQAHGSRNLEPRASFELISGERRWRAAKLLGWATIEAKVIETQNESDAAAKGLVENLQREDLNPMEEAEGFEMLHQLDPKTWTQEKIGKTTGRSQAYISQGFKLLALPPEIQKNIRALILSRSHSLELTRLPNQKLQLKAFRQIPGKLTWEETRALVDQMLAVTPADRKPGSSPIDPLQAGWEKLQANPKISQSSWQVTYKVSGQWVMSLRTPGITPVADMTQWLKAALAAIQTLGPDKSDNLAIDIAASAKSSKPKITIKKEYAPKDEAEHTIAEADAEKIRLPKTAAERAELMGLIANGPTAVYSWIYGPKSFYLKNIQGKSWTDLGMVNPEKDVAAMVEELRLVEGI